MEIEVQLSFLEEERQFLPADAQDPALSIPDLALLPVKDDVIFVSPRSAWVVVARAFQQLAPDRLQVQIWLLHSPESLLMRNMGKPALVR